MHDAGWIAVRSAWPGAYVLRANNPRQEKEIKAVRSMVRDLDHKNPHVG